jgi:two-component system, NtrC family, sensor kinase
VATLPRQSSEALTGLGAAVLDALPISLYVVDRDLKVVVWNSQRERGTLGRPRREVLGRPLQRVLSPLGFRATVPILRQVFATGNPHEETTETQGSRLYHIRRLPVTHGNQVSHVISWFEDITDQRALEMRLIASDRLAYLGQLVAGVAHEVSNPLAGIAGCAEALASLALRPPTRTSRREAREFRDLIRGEVARCERIVRSLLDAARPDPGTVCDVAATIANSLRLLERHPAFARVRVVSKIPKDLMARIDPDSVKQVIMALAVNAARAMPAGGVLTIKGGRARGDVVVDVIDTGPGVPPAVRPHIFEPFFTTDSAKGAGLGLAIARSLVRSRGGDLLYWARPKAGGSFRIQLKAAETRSGR